MRVAIILCGQVRTLSTCIPTFHQYLFPCYQFCDVFCVTQDCNCIKPRIYTSHRTVNQYVFFPVKYDIEQLLKDTFQTRLKQVIIRKGIYESASKNCGSDLILKNSLGWADNFKEMKLGLTMAFEFSEKNNFKYDLYIKVRYDVCFCSHFKIENVMPNTMYVHNHKSENNKNEKFLWDAVFGMDEILARHMCGFYDYYIQATTVGLDKCFKWIYCLNAEEQLLNYVKSNDTQIVSIGDIGYPFTWLIGDIKNKMYWCQRQQNFNMYWQRYFTDYANKCVTTIVDVRELSPFDINSLYQIKSPKILKKKIALMLSGQFRDYEICMSALIEYLIPHYDCDIYVSTQDACCIKPRLGHGVANQYVVVKADIENIKTYLNITFGNMIKNINIRKTYQNYIDDQDTNLIFNTIKGCEEIKTDMNINIDAVLNSGIDYDMYIHIRSDVLLGRPMNKIKSNFSVGNDLIICMDKQNAYNKNYNLNNEADFIAFPIKWLISDIKDANIAKKRHRLYSRNWIQKIDDYAQEFRECVFDLHVQK